MAENVVKIGAGKADKKSLTSEQKLGEFLGKNKALLIGILIALVAAVAGYAIFFNVSSAVVKKNLDKIETIEYSLTKGAESLDESDLAARRDAALSNLGPYLNKGGIAGARANMLAADIYGQKKDWQAAKDAWLAAANKRKGTYLESLCNFNAAAACEELGKSDDALALYEKVAADKNFIDRSRAYFSAGRIKEGKGDTEGAIASYEAIDALEHSNDDWNDLAKTRLLDLKK